MRVARYVEQYYSDSLNISKQSLINLALSNGNYELKHSISETKSKVLIIVGEKEIGVMKKSARRLRATIDASELYIAPKMKYGEFSLANSDKYAKLMKSFFGNENILGGTQ